MMLKNPDGTSTSPAEFLETSAVQNAHNSICMAALMPGNFAGAPFCKTGAIKVILQTLASSPRSRPNYHNLVCRQIGVTTFLLHVRGCKFRTKFPSPRADFLIVGIYFDCTISTTSGRNTKWQGGLESDRVQVGQRRELRSKVCAVCILADLWVYRVGTSKWPQQAAASGIGTWLRRPWKPLSDASRRICAIRLCRECLIACCKDRHHMPLQRFHDSLTIGEHV